MTIQHGQQQWDARNYDRSMPFVSAFGQEVVQWLNPQAGERIIDWGCGTGDLSARIAESGAKVHGIDFSQEMIREAMTKYPHLSFEHADGQHWSTDLPADAIFSNAALHWMKDAPSTVRAMAKAVRPGGRLVAEFGGKGNIASISMALEDVMTAKGWYEASMNPWYFPSIGEYASLLEQFGFRVMQAIHFDRPTSLQYGEQGMVNWLDTFAGSYLNHLTKEQRVNVIHNVVEQTRPHLMKEGQWVVDYSRIRVYAVRNG
ncbi:class I SAM-dependent methyltransferase [Paenibacillus guangzhouensis]|uniref:class I SAM-dependent methyltransferase n=1 Tax=Paenibacillus guangzhouensis TaxID=1473112 RepID=UPI0012676C0B|nr:methyltransferase domain-containing protein [Paenibacillus guangzhouensis]